jgi:hypothetical protein
VTHPLCDMHVVLKRSLQDDKKYKRDRDLDQDDTTVPSANRKAHQMYVVFWGLTTHNNLPAPPDAFIHGTLERKQYFFLTMKPAMHVLVQMMCGDALVESTYTDTSGFFHFQNVAMDQTYTLLFGVLWGDGTCGCVKCVTSLSVRIQETDHNEEESASIESGAPIRSEAGVFFLCVPCVGRCFVSLSDSGSTTERIQDNVPQN